MQPLPLGKDIHGQVSSPDVHSIDQKREKEDYSAPKITSIGFKETVSTTLPKCNLVLYIKAELKS